MTVTFARRKLGVFAVLAAVLMLLAFGLSAWSFYSAHQQTCQARDASLDVLTDILHAAQASPGTEPRTKAQRVRADAFYASAYARINQARCS